MADEDYSRPYVGYRSAGRRPESQQDRRAAADAPLSALRGYVAGTLGLPGDIEGLLRMLTPGVSNETALPGSEYFRGVLPLKSLQDSLTGRAFQEVGGAAGGAGLTTGARAVGKGAGALGRMTAEQVARGVEGGSPLFAAAAPAYVVKPKGGNWLAGQSERITEQLKTPVSPTLREDMARAGHPVDEKALADVQTYNTWVDKKLRDYVRNEMATPEDPLRAMAEKWATEKPQRLAEADAKVAALNAKTRELMQERGVPEAYLTRHRQDVIAAEKARDLIEAREALHTPMQVGWEPTELAAKRLQQGFPSKGMGESDAARAWEQAADEAIGVGPAGKRFGDAWGGQTLADNPWLAKVPPETPTYTGYGLNELGFEHLTDELVNALNPNSGLPAELLLKYSDLPKKTVPDIVNRVADINAWRAAQKSEADLSKANNAAVVTFKEYPEQGLAWKQIKTPEALPEGWRETQRASGSKGWTDPEGQLRDTNPNIQTLSDALKYEGDTMQHCVGGYCPDVESGRSQIFSLRDEKGRPHATIEVKAGRLSGKNSLDEWKAAFAKTHGEEKVEPFLAEHPEIAEAFKPAINQIKGLKNGPPEAKYLPQIQDFIKSGNWSEINDTHHAKMRRYDNVFNENEQRMIEKTGEAIPNHEWLTGEDIQRLHNAITPEGQRLKYGPAGEVIGLEGAQGFAAGGYVEYDPARVDQVMQRTRAGFAEGGEVDVAELARSKPKMRGLPTPDDLEFLRRFNVTGGGSSNQEVTQLGGRVGYTQPIDEDTLIRMGLSGHYAKGKDWRNAGLDRGDIGFERKLDRNSTLKASLGAGRRGVDEANISYNRRFADGGAVNAGNEPMAYDPTKISSIVAQLHKELNNG